MKSLLAFLAVLGLSLLIAGAAIRPPAPVAADAPEAAFSAERAMADIRRIARAPHPTGSAENAHVRDYLVRRLEDLGLEVSIQRAEVLRARNPGWAMGANVENIIATLPGEDREAPVILLMSHYDSAPGSPGAADDAAGVASSLEAVRAILADDRPRPRDLVVLITDAEEQGLLGAQAFFEEHPLRERIGAIDVRHGNVGGARLPQERYDRAAMVGGQGRAAREAMRRLDRNGTAGRAVDHANRYRQSCRWRHGIRGASSPGWTFRIPRSAPRARRPPRRGSPT